MLGYSHYMEGDGWFANAPSWNLAFRVLFIDSKADVNWSIYQDHFDDSNLIIDLDANIYCWGLGNSSSQVHTIWQCKFDTCACACVWSIRTHHLRQLISKIRLSSVEAWSYQSHANGPREVLLCTVSVGILRNELMNVDRVLNVPWYVAEDIWGILW